MAESRRQSAPDLIIDAHMHIWDRIEGRVGGSTPVVPLGSGRIRIGDDEMMGMPGHITDCAARAELVLGEFDAAGVSAGVVVQEYLDGPQNDYLLDVCQRHPGRFFAHALPDWFLVDGVAAESFALFDRGFRGLKMCGGHVLGKVEIDDDRLFPIWERMEGEGLVLAIDFSEGEVQVPSFEKVVMARHPALKVAIGHFGMPNRGGWPGQLRLCRHDNVFMECGGIVWLYRHEGVAFDGAVAAIREAATEVGMEKLMWGSDWPRTMVDFTYQQSLDFVAASGEFSDDELAGFLGCNAAGLYQIEAREGAGRLPVITEG